MRAGILLLAIWPGRAASEVRQPIDFPHDRHVSIGLECVDCHVTADSGVSAGMPSIRKCMFCHKLLGGDAPGVKKVREYASRKREIPWVRIYRFEGESHVRFEHAPHVLAKVDCKTCHGDVAKMTVAQPVVRHTMGSCLTCHRQNKATEDCAACHY